MRFPLRSYCLKLSPFFLWTWGNEHLDAQQSFRLKCTFPFYIVLHSVGQKPFFKLFGHLIYPQSCVEIYIHFIGQGICKSVKLLRPPKERLFNKVSHLISKMLSSVVCISSYSRVPYIREMLFYSGHFVQKGRGHTAPTYLLHPLGKWGSKWGDFHWAMGYV